MEIVPVNIALPFEVTYDRSDLIVGMMIYNVSGSSPVLIAGPIQMINVYGNTYYALFNPDQQVGYVAIKAVYTDSEMTQLSPDYAQGSESFFAQSIGQAATTNGALVGVIISNPPFVVGVQC